MRAPIKATIAATIIVTIIASQPVIASGFVLNSESSAVAIGNYSAGIAAEAADASIGWYNPAGLVLLKKQQLVVSGIGVFPRVLISGSSDYITTPDPALPSQTLQYAQSTHNYSTAPNAFIPSLHYALPLGEHAAFGFSIVAPYGLATNYDKETPFRYTATLTKLETFNFSPEIAGRITDHLSMGAGLDLEYATVAFNQIFGSPAYLVDIGQAPTILDSQSYNTGNSFGIGYHVGVLLKLNEDHTRLGLNYLSQIRHQFNGNSILEGRFADPNLNIYTPELANPNARYQTHGLSSNNMTLPGILTLSAYQDINDKLAFLGSVLYTSWGSFRNIALNGELVGVPVENPQTGGNILTTVNSNTIQGFINTWRFALGANYHINSTWMLRMGGGYDQTPTVDAYRSLRLPDTNRWALAIGAHYQALPTLGFDAGYTHLFGISDNEINTTSIIGQTSINAIHGTNRLNAQLFALQLVWSIDKPSAPRTK